MVVGYLEYINTPGLPNHKCLVLTTIEYCTQDPLAKNRSASFIRRMIATALLICFARNTRTVMTALLSKICTFALSRSILVLAGSPYGMFPAILNLHNNEY